MNGDGLREVTARGEPIQDDSFVIIFNAHHESVQYLLPTRRFGRRWRVELVTSSAGGLGGDGTSVAEGRELIARAPVQLEARSLVVLRRVR